MSIDVFDKSDKPFRAWIKKHPDGFVLNTGRSSGADYLVIHRADCQSMSGYTSQQELGAYTERKYIKVCSLSSAQLAAWARNNRPKISNWDQCKRCNPDVDDGLDHRSEVRGARLINSDLRVKHFVIYHSVAKRGPVAERDVTEPFAILTNRPVTSAVGQRVWLISGSGKPTNYRVHYAFTALDAESGEDEGFRHRLWGVEGVLFTPPARIDQEPWFAEFAAAQGNFAFGLSQIAGGDAIEGLERLVQNHATQAVRLELPMPLAPLITEVNYPDEVSPATRYVEGAVKQVTVNAYERDPAARAACIEHYGCQCVVCGFDFGEYYGELGAGYIHVHHLTPLAELGSAHEVDPVRDLVPVCPNCHAMLHTGDPPPSVEELAEIYARQVSLDEDGEGE